MAKTQPKKKAAPPAKRAAGKSAAKKAPAKAAKAAAGKSAKKSAPAAAKKPVARKPTSKPAPKPVPKHAKSKTAPAKSAKATKSAATATPNKRAVAVSHRPQSGAVAVQARPNKATTTATVRTRSYSGDGSLPSGTTMTEDQVRRAPDSAYMNDNQLAFFQDRLLQMRSEVLARELDVKERLHQREVFADPADRASAEEEHWLDLRLRERESLLLKKIDDALRRIRDREYGYCEKTGEAIGIARLLARPTATVCVDIKGQDERAESQYRDR
jgi:DnaK suppressor protein